MEWPELVLEYVKALAWPLVVGGAVYAFRRQIAAKIGDLKEANTPVGGASFFDREARELEGKAADAAERQEDAERPEPEAESEPPTGDTDTTPTDASREPAHTDRRRREAVERRLRKVTFFQALSMAAAQLTTPPDFGTPRSIAATAPTAAVMLAYTDLEKVARAAWTVSRMEVPRPSLNVPTIVRELTQSGLDADFAPVSRELADLRNRVTHGIPGAEVSPNGALDFIGTCESLSRALANNGLSKLRHPLRAHIVHEWIRWADNQDVWPDDPST